MERFIKGDVIVSNFPFSDLSESKRRPALIIAVFKEEILLCQITSQYKYDEYAIELTNENFKIGNLNKFSHIRPNRIFTADKQLVERKIGTIKKEKLKKVIECIENYLKI